MVTMKKPDTAKNYDKDIKEIWDYLKKLYTALSEESVLRAQDMSNIGEPFVPHKLVGAYHTESGLTTGDALLATGGDTFAFGPITESKLSLSNVSTANTSLTKHGLCPILSGNASQYLGGDGTFSIPSGIVNSYLSQAFNTATSISVTHGFGQYPAVDVIDSTGAVIIPSSIVHDTTSHFTVTLATSTTGTVIATIGSPQPQSVRTVSIDYTALTSDRIIHVDTAGKTITLYTVSGNTGREVIVDNGSTGNIYVDGAGSETIEGELTQTLPPNSAINLYCTGTLWRIY